MNSIKPKPQLSFWQIWNMSFGFMGIQFGFALQNGNASQILRTFGAEVEHLSWFWLAAPLVGMIVQPIVGYYSDKTWTQLGRRRPFFLAGAILSSVALCFLPNASLAASFLPPLFVGAGILMVMDASFNLAMEPFRALVADNLSDEQRTTGFSVQTLLIGLGAVIGSAFPLILTKLGASAKSAPGTVSNNVLWAFYIGAVFFIAAILWTIFKTREYPPKEYELYHGKPEPSVGFRQIFKDFGKMPRTMKQLGLVQFFSWFALFTMWVYTYDSIATHTLGLSLADKDTETYKSAGLLTGTMFSVYNFVAMLFALMLIPLAGKFGRKKTHAFSLTMGGLGLISIYFIRDTNFLVIPMIGVGLAWASILAMPYVILSSSIPPGKMGVYMGIFNFFITLPQIVNGVVGGPIVKYIYGNQPIYALVLAGFLMICGAISVLFVYDPASGKQALNP
jgi:maltose/moltooligosaccharide transporter